MNEHPYASNMEPQCARCAVELKTSKGNFLSLSTKLEWEENDSDILVLVIHRLEKNSRAGRYEDECRR